MNQYRERGFPFLLPFLAGAVVGPIFFNGFNGHNNNNCQGPNCVPIYTVPYAPVYPQAPIYPPGYTYPAYNQGFPYMNY